MTDTAQDERQRLLADIQAAIVAQELERAVALSREALERGIDEALPLNLRAYWHESQGRNAEALADLIRAQRLAPDDIAVLNALGLAYARLGRMREAAQTFDGIVRRNPQFGPAHFNKGWTSEDLGELDVARQCYEEAAALDPAAAEPAVRLAALAARQGDWPAAREQATRALALQPGHPLATVALAEAEQAGGDTPGAERRLAALLAEPQVASADRARAESVLGDLLNSDGRTAEAFAAYTRRNAILHDIHQARYAGPGVQTMPQYLTWLSAAFERQTPVREPLPPPRTAGAEEPRQLVFVLGFARSGTTLLEEVLGQDPSVVTTQERDALSDSVREYLTTQDGFDRLPGLGRGAWRGARARYASRIAQMGLDARGKVLVDKQPFNTYKLPLIAKLFPEAKIVFSVRDPRDVVLSCFRRQFRMNASTFEFLDLAGTARLYDATMRIAELFRARLALDVLELRHEDLVADFETRLRGVCDFVGLDWNAAMRDFAQRPGRRAVATPSSAQLRLGLNASGIGAWSAYRDELAPVLPVLAPWVERFGYRPD